MATRSMVGIVWGPSRRRSCCQSDVWLLFELGVFKLRDGCPGRWISFWFASISVSTGSLRENHGKPANHRVPGCFPRDFSALSKPFARVQPWYLLSRSRPVVTRFAPSPTGYLHIGGARTALFNYLPLGCKTSENS